ncbi:hypothetical protein BDK51DRAFT_48763 [Blyttiomyces helicus]|uniref:Myb-like domain-containing protein n=1 Tax=Blyttiomyces helicus TaxID=388810 RepID=A0A4P9WAW9_9FUNG|nr:hypothetical protein BDK51DRAFT_48763 [Blyttiomyces helicus]|eukprot:RKO89749.1 hypothetical protein BDK51DRAFT_48763 [Blyttiomyces helicus]
MADMPAPASSGTNEAPDSVSPTPSASTQSMTEPLSPGTIKLLLDNDDDKAASKRPWAALDDMILIQKVQESGDRWQLVSISVGRTVADCSERYSHLKSRGLANMEGVRRLHRHNRRQPPKFGGEAAKSTATGPTTRLSSRSKAQSGDAASTAAMFPSPLPSTKENAPPAARGKYRTAAAATTRVTRARKAKDGEQRSSTPSPLGEESCAAETATRKTRKPRTAASQKSAPAPTASISSDTLFASMSPDTLFPPTYHIPALPPVGEMALINPVAESPDVDIDLLMMLMADSTCDSAPPLTTDELTAEWNPTSETVPPLTVDDLTTEWNPDAPLTPDPVRPESAGPLSDGLAVPTPDSALQLPAEDLTAEWNPDAPMTSDPVRPESPGPLSDALAPFELELPPDDLAEMFSSEADFTNCEDPLADLFAIDPANPAENAAPPWDLDPSSNALFDFQSLDDFGVDDFTSTGDVLFDLTWNADEQYGVEQHNTMGPGPARRGPLEWWKQNCRPPLSEAELGELKPEDEIISRE